MDFLTKEIEKTYGSKYSFLKLLDVVYDKYKKTCTITFLFPETKDEITDLERQEIQSVIESSLNLYGKTIVKYRKSFRDESLIVREVLSFMKKNYQSCSANITKNQIVCERLEDGRDNVKISLSESVYNFFKSNSFVEELLTYLRNVFIGDFQVSLLSDNSIVVNENILYEKNNELISAFLRKPKNIVKRYDVSDVFMLFGTEITPKPEYISNIKEDKQSVILSGVISNFAKKQYTKRREKVKGENAKQNAYYSFKLSDEGGSISTMYFSGLATEKKMDKLCDGSRIICIGDIKSFNNQNTLYIKSLGLCDVAKQTVCEKENDNLAVINEYMCVKPQKYSIKEQESFLGAAPIYTSFINNNTFVVYDFETTGLLYDQDDIIEIGACKIVNGEIAETFQTFISTEKTLSDKIVSLTSITNKMLVNAPSIDIVLHDFALFCKDSIMVGHNSLIFDSKFLQFHSSKCNVEFNNEQQDTMYIAKSKLKIKNYKLGTITKALNIVLTDAHRALNDALATAKVFLELNKK